MPATASQEAENQSLARRAVVFNKEIEMEINQQKTVKVNAKTLRIYCKVSDRFTYAIDDAQGD